MNLRVSSEVFLSLNPQSILWGGVTRSWIQARRQFGDTLRDDVLSGLREHAVGR